LFNFKFFKINANEQDIQFTILCKEIQD